MSQSTTTATEGGPAPDAETIKDRINKALIDPQTAAWIDRSVHVGLGKLSGGASPSAVPLAYLDWLTHLGYAPGRQAMLTEKAIRGAVNLWLYAARSAVDPNTPHVIEPDKGDYRFRAESWNRWPFNVLEQQHLLVRDWWNTATTGVPGVTKQNEQLVSFYARQTVDMFSPSNSLLTNPEVQRITREERGANLWRGWKNFMRDVRDAAAGRHEVDTSGSVVGQDVAITPGKVIFRNHLCEVIQYSPTTPDVYAEPVLFVPAWIMKYYILDLSPGNSMYKYLVDAGHTVFTISWVNPTEEHRGIGMEEYLSDGVFQALDVVTSVLPDRKVHMVGYCLGGTILSIAAAALARDHDDRMASMTLFAGQTDFSEPGELSLFITEDQISFLEDQMADKGYLTGDQMHGTFQMLRSNDLVWGKMIDEYLLGRTGTLSDLMAWNADTTRMPATMHTQYLRRIFQNNELAQGHYHVRGRSIALRDILVPIFTVGTEKDHVAPWRSVYKINLLANSDDVTFVLTSGGHNAGILSEPGHPGRSYLIGTHHDQDPYEDPDEWVAHHERRPGSWWEPWQRWLADHSAHDRVAPPPLGNETYPPIADAPGEYILQK
jgi:polyhydroxyalkanoate synthase